MSNEAKIFKALLDTSDRDYEIYADMYINGEISEKSKISFAFEAMLALAED